MSGTNIISKQALNSIYVSYSWDAEKQTALVDRVDAACKKRGITLNRDVNRIQYGDSIKQFMQELGKGGCIIVVLSEQYLKSEYCMYELLEIEKNKPLHQRIFPVVLRGARIYDFEDRLDYIEFWDKKRRSLEEKLSGGAVSTVHQ